MTDDATTPSTSPTDHRSITAGIDRRSVVASEQRSRSQLDQRATTARSPARPAALRDLDRLRHAVHRRSASASHGRRCQDRRTQLVAEINANASLTRQGPRLQRQRQAAHREPVDGRTSRSTGVERDRRLPSTAAPSTDTIERQRRPQEPGHPVQRPARPARQARRRRLVQRHQPAARRQAEAHLQRDRHLDDRRSRPRTRTALRRRSTPPTSASPRSPTATSTPTPASTR